MVNRLTLTHGMRWPYFEGSGDVRKLSTGNRIEQGGFVQHDQYESVYRPSG